MSYEMVKSISIKGDKIFITSASSNVFPAYYERLEYKPSSECNSIFALFLDLIDGNFHVTNLSKNTIKYAYATIETKNAMNEREHDLGYRLFSERKGKTMPEIEAMYEEWFNYFLQRLEDENGNVRIIYKGYYNVTLGKYGRYGYQRFRYGGLGKMYPRMQAKIFLHEFSGKDLKIIE